MKPIKLIVLLCLTVFEITAQTLPTKTDIINTLKLVNNAWMANHPQTATVHSACDWLEGAYFTGHLAFFDVYPQKENINHAYNWGLFNTWSLGIKPKEADNQCAGQAYMDIFVANGSKDDAMLAKINTSIQNMVNKTTLSDWDWIDALYMAMPLVTRYGDYFNKSTYLDKSYALFRNTKVTLRLYNETDGFWHRDIRYMPPTFYTQNGKNCYWSRGNGWVFGSLVRTLKYLPKNSIHRQEYIDIFKNMAQALKKVQRTDGFWNVSLGDPNDYPGPETSGTGFFTYGIAWGINEGILDSETYLPTVAKAWNGLVATAIHTDGRVGYVQGVGDKPSSSQPVTSTSYRDYGEGTVLLAGSEVVKLAPGVMPLPADFYIKSVEVISSNAIKLNFYEEVDKLTAENIQNYSINKSVQVLSALLSDNKMSVNLVISNTSDVYYGLILQNVKSVSGKTIAERNGKQFKGMLTTGISTINNKSTQVKIYPNPTNSSVIIDLKENSKSDIFIYDVKGTMVYSAQSQTGLIHIDTNCFLNTGLYLIMIKDLDHCLHKQKIIIK